MAITPNVSGEQSVKLSVRSEIKGGANPWWSNPDYAVAVNALAVANNTAVFNFNALASGNYVVSGINGTTTMTGTISGTSTVSGLVAALNAAAPTNTIFFTPRKPTDFVYKSSTQLYVTATGSATLPTTLVVTTGNNTVATVVQVTGNLTTMSAAYPSYFTTPNALPSWVDDATVHAYQLDGAGAIVVNSGLVVQKQVRQIKTDPSETMQMDGYFAAYQSNLNQTEQKNTKQQQC